MSTLKLVWAEIRYRWLNFLISLVAIVSAATLFVAGPTLIAGYAADTRERLERLQGAAEKMQQESDQLLAEMDKKTIRIMRDLGVNLRIVHEKTNMGDLYTDFVAYDFPEEYVQRLAKAEQIETVVHVVATLQERIKWNERTVLLVGTLPVLTVSQKNEEKPHMVQSVQPGTVMVGNELGAGLQAGDKIDILGQPFTVAQIMPEYGGLQDVQLVVDLHDAQRALNKPERINQILALSCKCKGNRLSVIRKELEGVLPDTKVTEQESLATARETQRDLVAEKRARQMTLVQEEYERQKSARERQEATLRNLAGILMPLAVLVSALVVGLLTWLNVRERRPEIGLLRALGKGSAGIAGLFLGKAVLLGFLGGLLGCAVGYMAARLVGSQSMDIAMECFAADPRLLLATVLGAPLVCAMASYLPTLTAVTQDPAVVLMDV